MTTDSSPEMEKHTQDLRNSKKNAQVIVIHEVGTISPKRASEFIIPIDRQVVRFSFPTVNPGFPEVPNFNLSIDNSSAAQPQNFANMNAIAHTSLEDKRLRLILKGGVGLGASSCGFGVFWRDLARFCVIFRVGGG